ncbi:MAG: flagellar basal body M-ring protein FliF [Gammaproteobacteria bacterium]|nr:flagellar basal body M-ring protein FliF [Gammaproteobacteria bacterium]
MALVNADNISKPMRGFSALPILRQIGLMAGLAASVALGGAVVMWSQSPDFRTLYSDLAEQDVVNVSAGLQQAGIPFKVSDVNGSVSVPADQLQNARLKLAAQGLPKGVANGFELLDQEQGFGSSQFMEKARYQRALEGELARTVSAVNNVQSARVHLAIPKRSAFVRDRKAPSASVLVQLYPGRTLSEGQVTAIVHLVSSSVPGLNAEQVSVTDQKGVLLTSKAQSAEAKLSSNQLEYTNRVENNYVKRIEAILSPMFGSEGVKAEVTAEVDFTVTEQTQESFNPDLPSIRSEKVMEKRISGTEGGQGIPGALTNQPPGEVSDSVAGGAVGGVLNSSRQTLRNYELDKTISHTKLATGTVRRLSVAVVINEPESVNEAGEKIRQSYTTDELEQFSTLVKQAIGFSLQRGDSVTVIGAPFRVAEAIEDLPEVSFLDRPGVWGGAKQALGIGLVLFLIFGVLRPVLRDLAAKALPANQAMLPAAVAGESGVGGAELAADQVSLGGASAQNQNQLEPPPPSQYETQLQDARAMAQQDPKRVAQVVKGWVADNG